MRSLPPLLTALFVSFGLGCAPTPTVPAARAAAHAQAPREGVPWASFSLETFARAKAERKFVLLDGTAEWCRPCRAMEATTYRDPAVRRLIDEHFIAVKVDIDANPDVEKLYADWGWPATVLFSPDAAELGKYQGYMGPEELIAILRQIVAGGAGGEAPGGAPADPDILRAAPTPGASAARAPKTALRSGS
jgi:uncharacterized protein